MKKDKGLLYTILLFNLTFNITGTGVPRIHGELKKFGYDISQSTVQRYIPKLGRRTTGQNWKTFLKNHSKEIISIDFLTVPTINFKLVHVLVVIEHYRRKLIYFNFTKNPIDLIFFRRQ